MSFLFVDRILSNDPGKHITGIKHVTSDDTYLLDDRHGVHFMPALIGETLGQLGAWSVIDAGNYQHRPVAGVASNVEVFAPARIGDTIFLETTINHWDDTAVEYHAVASVNDQVIFKIGQALGPMMALDEFSDAAQVRREFAMINRPGEYHSLATSTETALAQRVDASRYANFDHQIEFEPGERAVACKLVSKSAAYFPDHFARKPVLPLTILLQAKTQFMQQFLFDSTQKQWQLQRFRKIKMSEFVQPGDCVRTELKVNALSDTEATITLSSYVHERRVCIAQAQLREEKS